MSKRTNAEKQARKRQYTKKRKGYKPSKPFAFVPPEGCLDPFPPQPLPGGFDFDPGPIIDVALGMMFVSALKKTGLREQVLKILFDSKPEQPEAPGTKDLPVC